MVWLAVEDCERVEVEVGEGEGHDTERVNDPVAPLKPSTTTRYNPCHHNPREI